MEFLNVDYLSKVLNLLREAFKFKKHRAMGKFMAIVIGILLLPTFLIGLIVAFYSIMITFYYNVLMKPVNYLHELVNKEGKDVHPATQFVIYLVSWPIILLLYIIMALLSVEVIVTYVSLSLITYIWTLGGFKFHVFVKEEDNISLEVNGNYKPSIPFVYVLISVLGLLVIPIVLYLILYYFWLEDIFAIIYVILILAHSIFTILYIVFVFAPNPKIENSEEAVIEQQ